MEESVDAGSEFRVGTADLATATESAARPSPAAGTAEQARGTGTASHAGQAERASGDAGILARLWAGRRRNLIGWLTLAVLFGISTAVFGLPYSQDVILLWMTAALFVASLGDLGNWRRGVVRDWLPFYLVLSVYALLRGYASHTLWGPFVRPQVAFDKVIGFGTVPTVRLQRWLYHPGNLHIWDYACWLVYMSHFFVSFIVLAVLWKRNYTAFKRYLALFVGLTFIGYLVYVLYPAMPPWMASQTGHVTTTTRIIPVVWDHVGVHAGATLFTGGSRFDNNIAAMPSLHAAYPMLLLLFFWPRVRRGVRVLLVTYVLAMAFTLVYTGEHFVIDELVGWGFAFAVYFGGSRLLDWRAARRLAASDRAGAHGQVPATAPLGEARPSDVGPAPLRG
jgi:membrane-associated phospholipid phosphatase